MAPPDAARLAGIWAERWGSPLIASHGRLHDARTLPGFVAAERDGLVGALTFARGDDEIEVVTLDSVEENRGVGTALLDAAVAFGRGEGVRRLWLVTTNDNFRAIRFYQKRGWDMAALHRDAIAAARKLKPEIPLRGAEGVALRHEIEFERLLRPAGR